MQDQTNTLTYKNEVHIAGILADPPVLRYTSAGKAVTHFTVTTQYRESTQFHHVTCWEKHAERAALLTRGAFVRVVGWLQTRSYVDRETERKRYITEVVAYQFVGHKQ